MLIHILTRKKQRELEVQRHWGEATEAEWGLEGCSH